MTTIPVSPAPDRVDAALVKLAVIVTFGALAAMLDTTIVVVAVARLGAEFGSSVGAVQWVTTAYLLAMSMAVPLVGWAVGRYGAKAVWMFSLALFLAGSALCGAAWSLTSLVLFRIVQGVGGGMIMPTALTLLTQAAGPRRIGRAISIMSVPSQLAPIVGPLVGGLLISDLSWRWIFYLNVPFCALALLLAWRGLPAGERQERHPLDVRGLLLLSPALAALVYGLANVGSGAGAACLAGGVLLLAGFGWHARRLRTGPAVLDLRVLRTRSSRAAAALTWFSAASVFAAMLLLPLYYQDVRAASPLQAGMLVAPQGLGMLAALLVAGRFADRVDPRPVVIGGMAVSLVGTVAFTQVAHQPGTFLLAASLFLRGAGLGAVSVTLLGAAFAGLARSEFAQASTAISVLQRLGGSFGTAVVAVVLQHGIDGGGGRAGAYGTAFWWTLALTALALVPAFMLPRRPPAAERAAVHVIQPVRHSLPGRYVLDTTRGPERRTGDPAPGPGPGPVPGSFTGKPTVQAGAAGVVVVADTTEVSDSSSALAASTWTGRPAPSRSQRQALVDPSQLRRAAGSGRSARGSARRAPSSSGGR